jgi:hypothetical protein
MCIFCAAIPASMALGASAQARQNRAKKEAEEMGKPAPKPVVPAGLATAGVVALLATGSVVVHTRLMM